MRMSLSLSLLLVLFCFLLSSSYLFGGALGQRYRCGKEFGGQLCEEGLCCSKWGYCGNTSAYCGANCQSQCPYDPYQCGVQAAGKLCPDDGQCCSKWGFCGYTDAYCGSTCQSQCRPTSLQQEEEIRCGQDFGGALCRDGLCCSKWGHCGNTSAYCEAPNCQSQCPGEPISPYQCGPRAKPGAKCQDGMCCSKWGFCGYTDAYCADDNCQSQCPPGVLPVESGSASIVQDDQIRCGKDFGGALCPDGECCSNWGTCGNTPSYCDPWFCQSQCPHDPAPVYQCGPRAEPGSKCQDGFCCSRWGFCGNTDAYCADGNCQSQCSSKPPQPSTRGSDDTSSISSE